MAFENINFIDLVALTRITTDSTVERFGGLINSSFFDASNILGSLKQKGLVDFVTAFPNQSAITVTDQGKQLIAEVQQKASMQFDNLDMAILVQLSKGNRTLSDLTGAVNVTTKDLAVHLYKLSTQQFTSYELRNGSMSIMLTEKGFLCVKEGAPHTDEQLLKQAAASATGSEITSKDLAAHQTAAAGIGAQQGAVPQSANTPEELKALEQKIVSEKKRSSASKNAAAAVIAIVIAAAAALAYLYLVKAI